MKTPYRSSDSADALLRRLRKDTHFSRGAELPRILAALILLRWADFQEAEAEAVAAFEEEDFRPLLPAACHWRQWHMLPGEWLTKLFREELPAAVKNIPDPHHPLAGMIQRASRVLSDVPSVMTESLVVLIQWLAARRFETPSDRLALLRVFDGLLDQLDIAESSEFRTPRAISEFLVSLVDPAEGENFYDPCFGFGGILTAACDYVRKQAEGRFARVGHPELVLRGVDINRDAWIIAMARLILAGAPDAALETGNSLEREPPNDPAREGFDVAACNPPWGMRVDSDGHRHFPVRTKDGTSLFLQHVLSQLRPDGRAAVVVPQGFLFQQGKPEEVRRWILEHHRLEAVIGFPEGAFLPNSAIKAAVLLLRRNGGRTRRVRMVDATAFFQKPKSRGSVALAEDGAGKLIELVRASEPRGEQAWDLEEEELKGLGWELSVVRREKSGLEKALSALGKDVPVVPLKDLCDIIGGVTVKSENLEEKPEGFNAVPYIRIGDVQAGEASRGSSWVRDPAEIGIANKKRLQPGQVLVSRSGTIGKAGVVRNGAVQGIASSGFFVLTLDKTRIDPHYLVAYLQSESCAEWLGGHSTGTTIRGLRRQFLDSTPVPVPPLPVQQRVAGELRDANLGFLDLLAAILNESTDNPARRWLGRSLDLLSEFERNPEEDAAEFLRDRVFGRGFGDVMKWRDRAEGAGSSESWLEPFVAVFSLFQGTHAMPRGAALVSVLQQAITFLKDGLPAEQGQSLHDNRAKHLAGKCVELLTQSVEEMLGTISVTVEQVTESVTPGRLQELSFCLRNTGVLPVASFIIRSDELSFASVPVFLGEGEEKKVTVEANVPEGFARNAVELEWEGHNLAGSKFTGRVELVFAISNGDEGEIEVNDIGQSPYFVSEPVGPDREDIFFGRESTIRQIKDQVRSHNAVLLEGNRKAGKTSILKHLEGVDRIPGWLAVYSSLQAAAGDTRLAGMKTEAVWRSLATSIAKACVALHVDLPLPDGAVLRAGSRAAGIANACREGIGEDSAWEDFQEYLAAILEILRERKLEMVLMIDEFDKLQEGIENGITSPQIPENIRYLIQNLPEFSAIMTGSRRMQRLRHEYWSALYGLGNRIGVSALDEAAACRLVVEPVAGRLRYSEEAINRIIHLTARQPFLIQSVCNRIFDLAKYHDVRAVHTTLVEEASTAYIEDNEHFASILDHADSERQRFIVALCHTGSRGPDRLTFGVLKDQLLREGIHITEAELDRDLKVLRELELIEFTGKERGSVYRLAVPLMGQWLDTQQDFRGMKAKALAEQEASQ